MHDAHYCVCVGQGYVCIFKEPLLWITTHYSTAAAPLLIGPSLHLTYAASRRRRSWDWSHVSEIRTFMQSSGALEGQRHPAPSQHILLGLVSWQHWLIGLAGLRWGLAENGGIRSLPLIIFSLRFSESRGHTATKSKPCHRVCGRRVAQTRGAGRDKRRLCLVGLTSHIAHYCVMLPLLTVTSDVIVIEELQEILVGRLVQISLQCLEKVPRWPFIRGEGDIFEIINLIWIDTKV